MHASYPVLQTQAFILHTLASGEANKKIVALTKEYGILYIHAQGIRKETAKMRCMARPYGYVSLAVVKGKHNILKYITLHTDYSSLWEEESRYKAFVQLLRYVHQSVPIFEYEDAFLFNVVQEAATLFMNEPTDQVGTILLTSQVYILAHLGYTDILDIQNTSLAEAMTYIQSSPFVYKQARGEVQNIVAHTS